MRNEIEVVAQMRQLRAFLSKSGDYQFVTRDELPSLLFSYDWADRVLPEGARVGCNCCGQMVSACLDRAAFHFCQECVQACRPGPKRAEGTLTQ